MPGAALAEAAVPGNAEPGIELVQHISGMNDSTSFDSDDNRSSLFHKSSNIVSYSPSQRNFDSLY